MVPKMRAIPLSGTHGTRLANVYLITPVTDIFRDGPLLEADALRWPAPSAALWMSFLQ